jgi:hypothetical protein
VAQYQGWARTIITSQAPHPPTRGGGGGSGGQLPTLHVVGPCVLWDGWGRPGGAPKGRAASWNVPLPLPLIPLKD